MIYRSWRTQYKLHWTGFFNLSMPLPVTMQHSLCSRCSGLWYFISYIISYSEKYNCTSYIQQIALHSTEHVVWSRMVRLPSKVNKKEQFGKNWIVSLHCPAYNSEKGLQSTTLLFWSLNTYFHAQRSPKFSEAVVLVLISFDSFCKITLAHLVKIR